MCNHNRKCAISTKQNFSWLCGQTKWERQIQKSGLVFHENYVSPRVFLGIVFRDWCNTRIFKKKRKKIIPSDKLVEVLESSKTVLYYIFAAYLATIISAHYQTTFMFSQVECLYYGKFILFVLSFACEPNFRSRFLDIDFDKLS